MTRGPTLPAARPLLVALALLAPAAPAAAQIVNVQPLLARAGDDGFAGEATGAVTWRTGNVELLLVKGTLLSFYRTGIHRLIFSSLGEVGYKSGTSDADRFLRSAFAHLRYQVDLGRRLTWEAFAQAAHNEFKLLQWRLLAGTGPRVALVDGPAVSSALGLAYLFEHERVSETARARDGGRTEQNHRLSLYWTGRFALDELLTLTHTTYLQPRIDAPFDDLRIASETDLSVRLSPTLALAIGFDIAWDRDPPRTVSGPGVTTLDTTLDVSLAVAF